MNDTIIRATVVMPLGLWKYLSENKHTRAIIDAPIGAP